jgi:hypothetical protein
MIAIFLGGAQGRESHSPNHKQKQKQCARSAHQNQKQKYVCATAHTRTSISKPFLIFAFGYPSSTTE